MVSNVRDRLFSEPPECFISFLKPALLTLWTPIPRVSVPLTLSPFPSTAYGGVTVIWNEQREGQKDN